MPVGHKCSLLLAIFLFSFIAFSGCALEDRPFTLYDASQDQETVNTVAPVGGGGGANLVGDGCTVLFQSTLQLKISANPPGADDTLEKLDAAPIAIDPIPIQIDGNQVALAGDTFPTIVLDDLTDDGDLRVSGVPGAVAQGTYDESTGEIHISNVQFNLEVLAPDTDTPLLQGVQTLSGFEMTTGLVEVSGNLNPIAETGQPLDSQDRSLALVMGIVLPENFSDNFMPLDSIIGGGALTARFEGKLNEMPSASCEGGTAPAGGGGGGANLGAGLKMSIQDQSSASAIDFGNSLVLTKKVGDLVKLNCAAVDYAELMTKTVTITNTGNTSREVSVEQPKDTDSDDKKDSIHCSNDTEFIRGSVVTKGGAFCETVEVGGKLFETGDCTLPDAGSAISFTVGYLPYNYQEVGAGEEPPLDTGALEIFADGSSAAKLQLSGRTLLDNRDAFSVSKVLNGQPSQREIRNNGRVKVSLYNDPNSTEDVVTELVEHFVLKNSGSDQWTDITFELEQGNHFTVIPTVASQDLPPSNGVQAGTLGFEIHLTPPDPHTPASFEDHLTINLVKAGDPNVTSKLEIQLLGTVGIAPISGKWELHFDFFTAVIDHGLIQDPLQSTDFRQYPELAPAPLVLDFTNYNNSLDAIKKVQLTPENFKGIQGPQDLAALTSAERKKLLRVFTTKLSRQANGQDMLDSAIEGVDCQEPSNLNQAYQDGDCSHFYLIIQSSGDGLYLDESGDLTVPSMNIDMMNPYHASLPIWGASDPNADPSYILNSPLSISFSTYTLEQKTLIEEVTNETLPLVSASGVSKADLNVQNKSLGSPCPEDYEAGTVKPNFRCYVSSDGRYLQGNILSPRPGHPDQYEFVLVGATRLPPDSSDNTPIFLDGTLMYVAIQGRLCPEGSACEY